MAAFPHAARLRQTYLTATSLKDIFESADNQNIISFSKDLYFLSFAMDYLLSTFYCCYRPSPWVPAGFFPGVGKLSVWGQVPQQGPGMELRWGSRGESLRSRLQIVKVMRK